MTNRWLRLLVILWLTFFGAAGIAHSAFAVNGEIGTIFARDLPSEGRQTLALIRQGGPFPYDRDGIEFRNFERRLPRASRGYYREYTVRTPGERSRGARRIISGGNPPNEFYYTADHYDSFRRIQE